MSEQSPNQEVEVRPNALIVRPRGGERPGQLAVLQDCMRAFEAQPRPLVVVDLSALADLSSAGVGALVGLNQLVRARQGSLRLVGLGESARLALDAAGLSPQFSIYPTVSAALAAPK